MNATDVIFEEIESKSSLKPLGTKVLVSTLEGGGMETTTESGIVYNDNNRGPIKVLVLKVGDDVKEVRPRDVALWDRTTSMGTHEGFGVIEESSLMAVMDRLEE